MLTRVALLVALYLYTGFAAAAELIFTAPPRDSGEDESAVYRPIAEYLSAVTGQRIVYQHPGYWLTYQATMQKGGYDIVFDGPHFFSWRMTILEHEPLAKLPGDLVFTIFTRASNPKINTVKDLSGRTVCGMAPPNLATLTMYAQFPNASRQPLTVEVKNFKQVYDGVMSGKCLGGVMATNVFNAQNKKNAAKVLYTSPGVPNQLFSAGPRVTASDKARIARALLAPEAQMKMAKFFEVWGKDKTLVPATRSEYEGVAKLLDDVYGFEMAPAPTTPARATRPTARNKKRVASSQ